MSQILLDQPVSSITVGDLQKLIESKVKEALRDYELKRRDYFIDDEGYICFGNEQAYADYIDKQDRPPSEIKAYYVENGVKIVYLDYEPLPRLLAELEEVHKQVETGASMTEHGELLTALRRFRGIWKDEVVERASLSHFP
jgi:hypothetical protein